VYWDQCRLESAALQEARAELVSPTDATTFTDVFLTLLRSEQVAAVGMALDCYQEADAATRHGFGNVLGLHAGEVVQKAREMLSRPPMPARQSGADRDGADHASALWAMLNLAQSQDADLIADALEMAPNPDVLEAAAMAAERSLSQAGEPSLRLITIIGDIALDDSRPTQDRTCMLRALTDTHSPQAAEIAMKVARLDDLALQRFAAWILVERHLASHRLLVEQLVTSWPQDAPYPAVFVRERLQEAQQT
jgi:hypothetical protein